MTISSQFPGSKIYVINLFCQFIIIRILRTQIQNNPVYVKLGYLEDANTSSYCDRVIMNCSMYLLPRFRSRFSGYFLSVWMWPGLNWMETSTPTSSKLRSPNSRLWRKNRDVSCCHSLWHVNHYFKIVWTIWQTQANWLKFEHYPDFVSEGDWRSKSLTSSLGILGMIQISKFGRDLHSNS